MAVPFQQAAFVSGEVAPALWGRQDAARLHVGASTMRNGWASFRGGYYSRAGTAFVGFSKQTGRSFPPRLVPFQFNINQGLALEFGNFYMRVVSEGAFVTESPLSITGITRANPGVVSIGSNGAMSATSNNAGVATSYAPGELVTLAGGAGTPAVLRVTNTRLIGLTLNSPGTGVYAPANTILLNGGVQTTPVVLTVSSTQVVSATVAAGGAGGAPGSATVTGTTGTGIKFQANVTISGGGTITAVNSITLSGAYTVNPTTPAAEPVTGAGLAGAQLNLKLGVLAFTISTPGVLTTNPVGGLFTQSTSSGAGTGASFQSALMAPNALTVSNAGAYSVAPTNPVSQLSTTGTGTGATFNVVFGLSQPFFNGDWVQIAGVSGMTQVNGQTYVVANATPLTFSLQDVYGNAIDTSAFGFYLSGGTASRIFTLPTIYAEQDLPWLKFTQSTDTLSLCCVNQQSFAEYPPQDLVRHTDSSWTFTPAVPAPSVTPPASVTGTTSSAGSTFYQYVVTSVNPTDGTESIASLIASINNAVNISGTAGTNTLTWTPVAGVSQYNVYKTNPAFSTAPSAGALFGFAGFAFGVQFTDSNIVPDLTQVPPLAKNPFARGQILGALPSAGGSGYTTATATINTTTGSGAVIQTIIVGGAVVGFVVQNGGHDYQSTDTITITGDGTGATANLTVGPQSGTYPGVPAYFQERRVYGYTLNQPDTYFFSQPSAFTNYDSRVPSIDSDAIIGAPWSVQVNGIQAMIPRPGGLVVFTGKEAWQLTGTGGSSLNPQPLTPSTQQAQPQAFNGCDDRVPPISIAEDIIYVQSKGAIYRDLTYQYYLNVYTGSDLTVNSGQLFTNFEMVEHAWCEEPFKLLWAVRSDGAMLSLTWLKSEQIKSWSRHDTNGLYKSVCSVTETDPAVDALYLAVQRFPNNHTAYMIERMDDRLWTSVEDTWCVDCGLSLPQPQPAAALTLSSATGLGSLTGVSGLVGGQGYSAGTTARVNDPTGTGATVALTILAGVITAITFPVPGAGYSRPALEIDDPAGSDGGSGASATVLLSTTATATSSPGVFGTGTVGQVIRAAGGVATITASAGPTTATLRITTPFTAILPNSGGFIPPQPSGSWTMTAPVSVVTGLNYLAGVTVTGLADGAVVPPTVVSAQGTVTLATPASAIILGLAFLPQLQSVYLNASNSPSDQGQRKKVAAVTARLEASGGFQIGANQPDGSALTPNQLAPPWSNMVAAPTHGLPAYGSSVTPLFTGDVRIPLPGGYDVRGQVAVQQPNPQPMQITSFIDEVFEGDTPQTKAPQRGNGQRATVPA